jgi:hypothetical protein
MFLRLGWLRNCLVVATDGAGEIERTLLLQPSTVNE